MKRITMLLLAVLGLFALSASAQARDYTEGQVTQVTSIQVTSGRMDEYMAYLRREWKPQQEALVKAGLIVGYNVYEASRRGPDDPDLYLTVTYANMAALDGFEERADKATSEISGDRAKVQKGVNDRNSYRTILGSELLRELKVM